MNFAFNAYSASQYSLLQNVATVCTKSSLFLCTCTGPCFAAYATNASVSVFACSKSDCDSAFSSAFKPERFVHSRLADCICNIKDKT